MSTKSWPVGMPDKAFQFLVVLSRTIGWGETRMVADLSTIHYECFFSSSKGKLGIQIAFDYSFFYAKDYVQIETRAFAEGERIKLQLQDELVGLIRSRHE